MSDNLVPYSSRKTVSPWSKALFHPGTLVLAAGAVACLIFKLMIIGLGLIVIWFGVVLVIALTGSSPIATKRNALSNLSFKHRPSADEAIKVLEEVERVISSAPVAYQSNFGGISLEVGGLVDKLIGLYSLIEGMSRYRSRASRDVGAHDSDSVYVRSEEALQKMEDEAARTLALLHDVQGRLLMILANATGEGEDSPASRAGRLSSELASQAKALDEARAYIDGDWQLDEKPKA